MNALRAFESAGRHLNLRAAADSLGVTQSAVSQHVRALEDHLGMALFDREPRGLSFTSVGRSYHSQISGAFAQIADATRVLTPSSEQVMIGVTLTFASRWLIPHLTEFTVVYPNIDLRILATERVSSFYSDEVDLAVWQGRQPFGASLAANCLFRQEIVSVCTPSIASKDWSMGDGVVMLHDTHNLWPRFLKEAGLEQGFGRKSIQFSQTVLSIEAALAGQGVALASHFLVARDLEDGRLVQAFETRIHGELDFHLLMPREQRQNSAVRLVWDCLCEQSN